MMVPIEHLKNMNSKIDHKTVYSIHHLSKLSPNEEAVFEMTHFNATGAHKWDRKKYRGEERPPVTKYRTTKPAGLYGAHADEYMEWRYDNALQDIKQRYFDKTGSHKVPDKILQEQLRQRLGADMRHTSWLWKGNVQFKVKGKDVFVVRNQHDLPIPENGMSQWEVYSHMLRLFDRGVTPGQWKVFMQETGIRKQWEAIQRKYKIMYIHPDFFGVKRKYRENAWMADRVDVYGLHLPSVVVFDSGIFLDTHYEPHVFDIAGWAVNHYKIKMRRWELNKVRFNNDLQADVIETNEDALQIMDWIDNHDKTALSTFTYLSDMYRSQRGWK